MNTNLKKTLIGLAIIVSAKKLFARSKPNQFTSTNYDNQLVSSAAFTSINHNNQLRGCDAFGCGHFGAPRGARSHKGVDFKVKENDSIKAPFDCKIIRYGFAYSGDQDQQLVEIEGLNQFTGYKAKIMYIKPTHPVGTIIQNGTTICKAGNISNKYGSSMINHVHFELYENGLLINPEPYFS